VRNYKKWASVLKIVGKISRGFFAPLLSPV